MNIFLPEDFTVESEEQLTIIKEYDNKVNEICEKYNDMIIGLKNDVKRRKLLEEKER
jgi:hypothetical protein